MFFPFLFFIFLGGGEFGFADILTVLYNKIKKLYLAILRGYQYRIFCSRKLSENWGSDLIIGEYIRYLTYKIQSLSTTVYGQNSSDK